MPQFHKVYSLLFRGFIGMVLIFMMSCSDQQVQEDLTWSKEKMIDVMLDIRVIEFQLEKHHVLDRDSVASTYRKLLLEIYDIDSATLASNLSVLQSNPKLAKEIEDKVLKKMADILKAIDDEE